MTSGLLEGFAMDDWLIDEANNAIYITSYDKRDDTGYINSISRFNT